MKTIQENKKLELTRHIGEKIVINDNVVVSVDRVYLSGEDYVVHLSFSAPKGVPIHREEIQTKIINQH